MRILVTGATGMIGCHAAAGLASFATVQMGGALYIQEEFVPAEVVRALSEERIRMADWIFQMRWIRTSATGGITTTIGHAITVAK